MLEAQILSKLFAAHAAALALYASQWLDRAAAEDVVHDVFLRLMEQEREPENARAWLYRSVRNAAMTSIRSRSRRRSHESGAAIDRPEWFTPGDDDALDAAQAESILRQLPQDQREVVMLRIWGQMAFKEIAAITQSPISTIFERYQAALIVMKQKLESRHVPR
jgi:RNA polymerase sigma-70 factor (ECF subfamily)